MFSLSLSLSLFLSVVCVAVSSNQVNCLEWLVANNADSEYSEYRTTQLCNVYMHCIYHSIHVCMHAQFGAGISS